MLRSMLRHAAAIVLLAFVVPQAAADPILLVYRADSRGPDVVFQHGFMGRGSRMDVLAHTLGGACEETDPARASTWVSTSAVRDEAVGFARGHLEGLPSGPQNRMWLYSIRPDQTYIVVPSLLYRVADEARAGQSGYTPQQGAVVEHLMYNTLISTEAEVIAHYVAPANIISATPMWFDANDDLQFGARQLNPGYLNLDTSAASDVADLQAFVPAASIRMDLMDDDGPSSGSESDQCAMSCDGATSASSFAATMAPQPPSAQCRAPKTFTPFLRDLILGS